MSETGVINALCLLYYWDGLTFRRFPTAVAMVPGLVTLMTSPRCLMTMGVSVFRGLVIEKNQYLSLFSYPRGGGKRRYGVPSICLAIHFWGNLSLIFSKEDSVPSMLPTRVDH